MAARPAPPVDWTHEPLTARYEARRREVVVIFGCQSEEKSCGWPLFRREKAKFSFVILLGKGRNFAKKCRARRERKHDQRGLGPSTNLATVVFVPRALSVKSSTLPWSAVNPCAAARSNGRSRSRSVSSPPPRSIARGATRASSRTEAESVVASCSETYGGSKSRSTRQMA